MKDLKKYYKEKDQPEKGNICRWHKIFFKFKKDFTKEVILDIGCGTSDFALEVLKRGAKNYIGVDPNPKNIDVMHKKLSKFFPNKFILINDNFDGYFLEKYNSILNTSIPSIITCFEVIEHLYEPHSLVRQIVQIMKLSPPGKCLFVLSTPNAFNLKRLFYYCFLQKYSDPLRDPVNYGHPEHIRGYSFPLIKDLLRKYDLEFKFISGNYYLGRYFSRHIVVISKLKEVARK